MKKIKLKKLFMAASISLAFTAISPPAHAQWAVIDGLNAMWNALTEFVTDAGLYLVAMTQEITAEYQAYLTTGTNSLISAVAQQDVMLAKNADKSREQASDKLHEGIANIETSKMMYQLGQNLAPSPTGCMAETVLAARGGSANFTSPAVNVAMNTALMYNSKNQVQSAGRIVQSHAEDSQQCTAQDVEQRRKGCSSVGSRAGSDFKAQSLFIGAGSGGNGGPAAANKMPDYSFTKEQYDTALRAVRNISSGTLPPVLDPKAEATTAGGQYLALSNMVSTRASMPQEALTFILSKKVHPSVIGGAQPTAGELSATAALKPIYQKIYGRSDMPTVLSEYEVLKLTLASRSDPLYIRNLETKDNVVAIAREQVYSANTGNQLLFNIWEQQEKQTMLLAGILAHLVDPVSKEDLKSYSDAAIRAAGSR